MIDEFDRPVFVVGSPRSGTTLMRSIMDAHPRIMCPPCETFLFVQNAPSFYGPRWEGHYSQLALGRAELMEWFHDHVTGLFRRLQKHADKPRFCEKTPAHVRHIDFIMEVFPHAQIVHMVRDGECVVRSLQQMPWAPSGLGGVRRNAWTWVNCVTTGRASGAKLPPDQYLEVRFEELIVSPRAQLERLFDFLGEEFAEQTMEFHLPRNNSWGLELRPFPDPVEQFADSRRLGRVERALFRRIAGPLMRELGYS